MDDLKTNDSQANDSQTNEPSHLDLGELIAHCQQAAKELGAEQPSVVIETVGLHGFTAIIPGMDPVASGRGRTAQEAASCLLERLVGRLRVSGQKI